MPTHGCVRSYFDTVGSKEGWTPSTFKSSRTSRNKDGTGRTVQDYMDEEDLVDAAESQRLQTSQAFAGLGSSSQLQATPAGLQDLFRTQGNIMGLQLLRRMGWRDGQGIGPKVRRNARLDLPQDSASDGETFLFAPENTPMIRFVRKTDRKGLGHQGEARLQVLGQTQQLDGDEDGHDSDSHTWGQRGAEAGSRPNLLIGGRGKQKPARGGFGVGVLNDTGSDEEDPYDIGPKVKYNRAIGGQRRRKKAASAVVNPALAMVPKFIPRTARAGNGLRRCHDGRLPLDGFALAKLTEDFAALLSRYAPPPIPAGWKSTKNSSAAPGASQFVSTADAAKSSGLDPRSRAAMLGEEALPGKSVFDYLSASARDKLAVASGKSNLPPGRGEVPAQHALSEEERRRRLWDQIPKLDRDTAASALSRAAGGPYADDDSKRARYRRYLEQQSNPGLPRLEKADGMTDQDFVREVTGFYECARIFKPMTGFMASRFTTSKAASGGTAGAEVAPIPEPRATDAPEEAARLGMFGHMTRSIEDFFPSALLCKRFNVKAPPHARADSESKQRFGGSTAEAWSMRGVEEQQTVASGAVPTDEAQGTPTGSVRKPEAATVDPERNEALEREAANAGVLRAIFGDSDSE